MSNDNNQAQIVVLDFKQTFELQPKRGTDPLADKTDARGFLLDDKGARIIERVAVDWVTFAPIRTSGTTKTTERISHMQPNPDAFGNDADGTKLKFLQTRWAVIEPAYRAWKEGHALPLNGTPLSIWPGLNEAQVSALGRSGIRSVEQLRDIPEGLIEKVPLPNMREMKRQAGLFLNNLGASANAEREAAKDQEIASMKERMAELEKLLDTRTAPTLAPEVIDDEVAGLRAELDAKGIDYDKRWAAPKLRAALANEAA